VYQEERLVLDVKEGELVGEVKERVRKAFRLGTDDELTGVESRDKRSATTLFVQQS